MLHTPLCAVLKPLAPLAVLSLNWGGLFLSSPEVGCQAEGDASDPRAFPRAELYITTLEFGCEKILYHCFLLFPSSSIQKCILL